MNGVWVAHFNAGAAHGSGIAVLREGEILGGDFSHSWVGTYEAEGRQVYARVRVAPHGVNGGAEINERERPFVLTLTGLRTERDATLAGHADENQLSVSIEMHRAV